MRAFYLLVLQVLFILESIAGSVQKPVNPLANLTAACRLELNRINQKPVEIALAIDTWGKPSGVQRGSFTALGDFYGCSSLADFQYVLIEGRLVIQSKFNLPSQLGSCFPTDCANAHDVKLIFSFALSQAQEQAARQDELLISGDSTVPSVRERVEHQDEKFIIMIINTLAMSLMTAPKGKGLLRYHLAGVHPAVTGRPWTVGAIITLVVLSVLGFLVLLSTIIEYFIKYRDIIYGPPKPSLQDPENETLLNLDEHPDDDVTFDEQLDSSHHKSKRAFRRRFRFKALAKGKSSLLWRLLSSFSMYRTFPQLFHSGGRFEELRFLDVVRTVSMWWVVLGHTTGELIRRVPYDLLMVKEKLVSFPYIFLDNAFFSVDSFFFLSSFLLAYMIIGNPTAAAKFNYIKYVVLRYLRLTPSVAAFMAIYMFLLPFMGSGPIWYSFDQVAVKCGQNWWTHLLYINNIHPAIMNDECLPWAWYLAADFQFYLVAPLIVLPLCSKQYRKLGVYALVFLVLLQAAWTISISAAYELPAIAVPVGKLDLTVYMDDHNRWLTYFYEKSWNHLSVFLLGILSAYIAVRIRQKQKSRVEAGFGERYPSWISILGLHIIGMGLLLATVCVAHDFIKDLKRWPVIVNAIYNYGSRVTWSLGLSIFTILCVAYPRRTTFLTALSSWNGWAVMGKLTFGVYMVHCIVLHVVIGSLKKEVPFSSTAQLIYFAGAIVLSYLLAIVHFIAIEAPIGNLMKAILKK